MVNVANKDITKRIAEAEGEIVFDKLTYKKIENLKSKKGSIKNIAIVAGIMGAKETSRIIPLCHNIPIDSVNVENTKNAKNHFWANEADRPRILSNRNLIRKSPRTIG